MAASSFDQTSALLLLPPPPSTSFEQFQQVYESLLSTVCLRLYQNLQGVNRTAILDIALALPGLHSLSRPRSQVFGSLQACLANLYRLLGVISVKKRIELDVPDGIDARIIFLDLDSVRSPPTDSSPGNSPIGPIVHLQTLARSSRLWNWIFYPDNHVGQTLATAFSSIYSQAKDPNAGDVHPISGVPKWTPSDALVTTEDTQEPISHYSVIVGGTFDHFHIGHKFLLTATALVLQPASPEQDRVLAVGVTGDDLLVNKKYAEFLESWDDRCRSVAGFLSAIMEFDPPTDSAASIKQVTRPGPNGKYMLVKVRPGLTMKLVQILDPFGPTITEENISALVVSKETRAGGTAINEERIKKGWKKLEVFEIDVLLMGGMPSQDVEDFASKLSSTEIRRRQMEMAKK
ncbi:hypothetical protein EYZ11_000766 [Aspergillus tanneri]|uniref:Cytidyltransferase-like domain-containing protein n=1 Tax=Aspergillus tanneri TaxID=1220188 RepID=A0A4S3JW76_9EURO|nr:uncharacterized protein ATNIH1004_004874 [Aspergillus tanneri]KAA8648984.1 hypothetical protein ATNIH1004_004874 [Aspergillus tanneri]THC99716.1 hypothetical protein EYZ11_000766 [Aspergillus tanneri]